MRMIRKTKESDLEAAMAIYDHARQYMRQNGNLHQWVGGYPSTQTVREDIAAGRSYLCCEDEEALAIFCFTVGEDATYHRIEGGGWLNDAPYGVVHRLGVCSHRGGVASFCFEWCGQQHPNLRVDTHRDNLPMQQCLLRNGFRYCGIIYLADGAERLAYQKSE